jgi:hypothetical protein
MIMRASQASALNLLVWLLLGAATMAQSPPSHQNENLALPTTSPGGHEDGAAAPPVSTIEKPDAPPNASPERVLTDGAQTASGAGAVANHVITVPAGTKVMMELCAPLHTTSATEGSGVYLETVFPIVQANRVVIPAGTQVLGVVDAERRPGRAKGKAQFKFHFTSMVYANNYVTAIDGALQSVPGNSKVRTQDAEGTIEPVDQIDRDLATLAAGAAGGFVIGSIHSGRIAATEQSATGAGIGAVLALGKVLFARGDEIRLDTGSLLEMVLTRPVSVELEHVPINPEFASQSRYGPAGGRLGRQSSEDNNDAASGRKAHRPRLDGLRWLSLLSLLR